MSVTRGRRALQTAGRALAPAVVFVATFLVVVRTGVVTGDPLLGPEIPGALTILTVFVWAIADGRRPEVVPRPVKLWAVAALTMSLTLGTLLVFFGAVATVALGGELSDDDLFRLLGYGAISAAVLAGGGTAVAAGGVLIGRAWSRR